MYTFLHQHVHTHIHICTNRLVLPVEQAKRGNTRMLSKSLKRPRKLGFLSLSLFLSFFLLLFLSPPPSLFLSRSLCCCACTMYTYRFVHMFFAREMVLTDFEEAYSSKRVALFAFTPLSRTCAYKYLLPLCTNFSKYKLICDCQKIRYLNPGIYRYFPGNSDI